MASSTTRFSLCDIDLNVEFILLPDLNIGEEEDVEETNNNIGNVFILSCAFVFVSFSFLIFISLNNL